MKKYSHLLFDLDQTLFDFKTSSKMALTQVFAELGLPTEDVTFLEYEIINSEVWKMLQEGKISAKDLKGLRWKKFLDKFNLIFDPFEINDFYLDSLVEYTIVYPKVKDLLKLLFDEFRLIAVTNGLERVQKSRLKISRLTDFFEHVVISEEIGFAKPQKEYFDHVFKLCYQPKRNEVIIIGDGLTSDIKGANNYGIHSIWYNPEKLDLLPEIQPTYTISKLHETIEILLH
jgi:YjjG family noncanonical pyrimidine nucleotidase